MGLCVKFRLMKILLADDTKNELNLISGLIKEWSTKHRNGQELSVALIEQQSGTAALEAYDTLAPEELPSIAILDIVMPDMLGTDLAIALRKKGFTGQIVFLTSSNEFASESYEAKAFAYLLKPVNKKKLFALLDELFYAISKQKENTEDSAGIIIKSKGAQLRLLFKELKWVEVKSHSLYFYIENKKGPEVLKIPGSLAGIKERLGVDARFGQSHASFIVNMDYVATVTANEALMTSGEHLPISRRQAEFRAHYIKYSLDKMTVLHR